MATPWPALGFALFGAVALGMGVLRHRGVWPLARRAKAAPASLADPLQGPPSIWHAGVIQGVDAARFNALCEAMFRQDACRTEPACGADDDFLLHRGDDVPPRPRLVRCHAVNASPVDEPTLRTFAVAIAAAQADAGIFIAAGSIGAEAIAFARQNAITLVDGPALLKLIVQRSARQQRALREIATPPAERRSARFGLDPTPAPAWFAMAGASVLAAWVNWPAPHETLSNRAEVGEPARLAATSPSIGRPEAEPTRQRPARPTPATSADLDPPAEPRAAPAAGRQVLRCTEAGRVTYLPADAACASGHGERITVFPTEGVNPFR